MKGLNIRTRSKVRYHRVRSSFSRPAFWRFSSSRKPATRPRPTPSTSNSKVRPKLNTLCARLKRFLPWYSKPKPQPTYMEDKKYHHVPVHAASDFLYSTTTGAMADVEALDKYELERVWSESEDEEEDKGLGLGGIGGKQTAGGGLVWDEKRLVDAVEDWRRSMVESN